MKTVGHETISLRLPISLLKAARIAAREAGLPLNRWLMLRLVELFPPARREALIWGTQEREEKADESASVGT